MDLTDGILKMVFYYTGMIQASELMKRTGLLKY